MAQVAITSDILAGAAANAADVKPPLDDLVLFAAKQAGGRLTLTSGTAVPTTDVTAATTLYYTPYAGAPMPGHIGVYTGTVWRLHSFSELSLSLAGLAANLPHDIYLYDNSGTLTLEALAWTNTNTRATGLGTQDGVSVKAGAATRRYLGTICTTGTIGQCEDSQTKRFVWNNYNRVRRPLFKSDAGAPYTYTGTTRQARGDTAQRVEWVVGRREDAVSLVNHDRVISDNSFLAFGIGINTTTVFNVSAALTFGSASPDQNMAVAYDFMPSAGYSYAARNENGSGAGTSTHQASGYAWLAGTVNA